MTRARALPIVPPFAAVGAAGSVVFGFLLDETWRPRPLHHRGLLSLLLSTTALAALLAAWTRRTRVPGANPGRLRFGAKAMLCGALNGALTITVMTADELNLSETPPRMAMGAIIGCCCALPFLPPLGGVLAAAMTSRRARPESIVWRCDRRGVWRPALASIGIFFGVWLALGEGWALRPLGDLLLYAALVGLCALVVADVSALRSIEGAARRLGALLRADADGRSPRATLCDGETVDLGLGDEEWLERLPAAGAAYRDSPPLRLAILGDVDGARAAVTRALRLDGLALGLTALLALWFVGRR